MSERDAAPLRAGRRVGVADEGGANRRLVLALPGWPGFEPGQFVMLSPGARGSAPRHDPLLPRPMAVYRARTADRRTELEILFKVHGRGTALLADARARLAASAWSARSARRFPDPPPGARALLVAGGTGIASVYELARAAARARLPRARAARRAQARRSDGRGRFRRARRRARRSPPRTARAARAGS